MSAERTYRMTLSAPQSDIDGLGHVSNVAYVRWIQEVAIAHSAAVGYDFARYEQLGAVFVVRRHEVTYLAPVFGGEEVVLATWIESFRGVTSDRHTTITRVSDGKEVVRAVTQWVLVSTESGRPRRIPIELAASFGV